MAGTLPPITERSTIRPDDSHACPSTAVLRPLQARSHGLTDKGRMRPGNEDQFLLAQLCRSLRVQSSSLLEAPVHNSSDHIQVLVVADGMGGHAGGERASALAIEALQNYFVERLPSLGAPGSADAKEELRAAVTEADELVRAEARRIPQLHGMGCTLTMACVAGRRLLLAHVGDSRCYLLRQGELKQLTTDHTLAQAMMRLGVLKVPANGSNPWKHIVTNAVGGQEAGVHVEVHELLLQPGDTLLLCSDGLTDMIPDGDLKSILEAEKDPARACDRLIAEANHRGGRDNITAIVSRYEAP